MKIKLGYFIGSQLGVSETFIIDLIKAFSLEKSIDLTIISGKREELENPFLSKTIFSGFQKSNPLIENILYKIGQIRGGKGSEYKIIQQKRHAYNSLIKLNYFDIDIAYVDYADIGILIFEFLKNRNIPLIVHVHGYDVTSKLKDSFYHKEFEKLTNYAHKVVAASDYIKRILILAGCERSKIEVIRLGIDTEKIHPKPWRERLKTNPKIIFLGRLTSKKHPIALVEAFYIVQKIIPEATLTFIGDGPLKAELVKRISKLKLTEKVELLGSLSREEAFPILNEHWIYAQHSVTSPGGDQEGFAISLAEAAAHSLPVVSTFHNGIPENVINGKTGFLVSEFDFEAMAEKIIYLIENPEIAQAMGTEGSKHIKKLCDPSIRTERIIQLFKLDV